MIPFIFGATLVAIVFVLADSLYYGTIQVMIDNVPLTDFVQVMDAITYPQKLLTIHASVRTCYRHGVKRHICIDQSIHVGLSCINAFEQSHVQQ